MTDWLELACRTCSWRSADHPLLRGCQRCGGVLLADVPADFVRTAYADLAKPAANGTARLALPGLGAATDLGEGSTPMFRARELGRAHGLGDLYIKNEGVNPTGSYKDRLNAVAVAVAARLEMTRLATSSTGNQAVSLAAYAAAAGLRCDAFLPPEAPRQAAAEVERLAGHAWVTGWAERTAAIGQLVDHHGYGYVGRNFPRPLANPYGLEGYKSIAYEIVRDLGGRPPDMVVMPSCGGDGIFGAWRGFCELFQAGIIDRRPRMVGCGLSAAPSVAVAWRDRQDHVTAIPTRPSIGLSLVDERGGDHALWAMRESGGCALSLDDADLVRGMAMFGRLGVLAEPAGAAGLAALGSRDWPAAGGAGEVAVVVMTGGSGRWPASRADLPGGTEVDDPLPAVIASLAGPGTPGSVRP
jgi:threonine synthase